MVDFYTLLDGFKGNVKKVDNLEREQQRYLHCEIRIWYSEEV